VVTKDNKQIVFDRVIRTGSRQVCGVEMASQSEHANVTLTKGKTIDINLFHRIIGTHLS
jgi:hypothetical protein